MFSFLFFCFFGGLLGFVFHSVGNPNCHGKSSLHKDFIAKQGAIVPTVVSHLNIPFNALKSIDVSSRYFI